MFRLKPNAWNDTPLDLYQQKEAEYGQFLRQLALDFGDPLLDYFGVDFFHDGKIFELTLLPDDKLRLVISCPNILRGDRYMVQKYEVIFGGVTLFSIRATEPASVRTFLGGEIDMVEEDSERKRKLVFLTDPEAWIEVIFDRIGVQPINGILREGDRVPTYSYLESREQ